ncbi:hypothetical protein A9Q81_02095 [Gammaproteobacteria bacterium 42_54_T18]|nr:hypothetical protein A9Q81_02095 [Gammaproteobacteria bacterium 42_54_T18]
MERNVDLLKSQFDIDREPFSDAGISGLFYPGAGRQQALEQLLHLVRYGPPLLFVTGDEGSGKTLLSHQLIRQLDSSIFSCTSIEATVLMDDRALMALICDGFNLQVELKKESVISALVRFAAESESYSQTALVVIDGVQNISEVAADFLAEIAKLVKDSGLRFLLLADTADIQQEGALASLAGLMDSLGQSLQLSPLDNSEVADYLSYRMRTAGLDGVRFSPQQVKQIAGESEGVIARVNQFARETLVHQVPVIAKEKRRQIISFWHLAVVAVISVGIVLLMVGKEQAPRIGGVGVGELAVDVAEMPVGGESGSVKKETLEVVLPRKSSEKSLVKPYEERAEVVVVSAGQSELIDLNYVESVVPEEKVSLKDIEPLTKIDTVSKIGAVAKTSQELVADKPLTEKTAEKMKWDDSIKTALNRVEPEVSKPEPSQVTLPKAVASVSSEVVARNETKSNKQNKKPRLNNYTLREKWLLSLDPKQYTLQMIGARDEAAVQEFISRYPSLTKVAYYKTLYKGGDWYVVIHGQFTTKNDARQAVTRLPKKLITSKPWARSLASVQKDIRMARL